MMTMAALASFTFLQQGCIKDSCTTKHTYTFFEPVYKTNAEVRANIRSNPAKPIINPGKIYIKGNFIFLNELNKGIHVIDNTDPSLPKNIAFIDIPGNVDIAVKGNFLYADLYTDLVTIDITDPAAITVKSIIDNVFPERYYYGFTTDSSKVITDWIKKQVTETIYCNASPGRIVCGGCAGVLFNSMDAGLSTHPAAGVPVGISGSMARFALVNDHLYTAGNASLKVIGISTPQSPAVVRTVNLPWGIETIYPFKNNLFLGASAGMYIYGLQDPSNPVQVGTFTHVRSCDPVIAEDSIAYVTLRSGTFCQGFTNQLDVLDISQLQVPKLIRSYNLTNPRGLSKSGDLLFICDGNDGVKIFNAKDNRNLVQLKQLPMPEANDVIAYNNIALVIAGDGLYQYSYSNPADIKLLSKLPVQK